MTEHQAEHSTEHGTTSPELGFSLGIISANELTTLLNDYPEGTSDFGLRVGALGELFNKGISQAIWRRYAAIAALDMRAFEDTPNALQVKAKYADLVNEAATAAVAYVDSQVQYINGFIADNSDLLTRNVGSPLRLERVVAEWYDDNKSAIPEEAPLSIRAIWSDGSMESVGTGADVYIDLTKTPSEIQDIVRQSADV